MGIQAFSYKRMGFTIKTILFCLFACTILHTKAYAWNVSLDNNAHLPEKFIAVSKQGKSLYVLEDDKAKQTLNIVEEFPTIYGEVEGDKIKEGDKKTPEGVYFVTTKIHYQLDFNEYGSGAYALNYPNPIDRIKRKTGSGIWIHSKGQPIAGQTTRGCIAVDLEHFPIVASNLPAGTPVVVANTLIPKADAKLVTLASTSPVVIAADTVIDSTAPVDTQVTVEAEAAAPIASASNPDEVITLTKEWNTAWEEMSAEFFEFYDAKKYSLAQEESYAAFQSQKEHLFSRLSWIDIEYGEIYALEGTDYWVTWFEQLYRASNLSTEGIRRLYWQKDEQGEYKVVAMEWIPRDLGLEEAYEENAAGEVNTVLMNWKQAWQAGDIASYASYYTEDAIQGHLQGEAIFNQKENLWGRAKPSTLEFKDIRYTVDGREVKVTFKQNYSDTRGYSDYGQKNITFAQVDGEWRIVKEDWRKLN